MAAVDEVTSEDLADEIVLHPRRHARLGASAGAARVRAPRHHRGRRRTRGGGHRAPRRPQSSPACTTARTSPTGRSRTPRSHASHCPGHRTRPPIWSRTSSGSSAAGPSTAHADAPRPRRRPLPRRRPSVPRRAAAHGASPPRASRPASRPASRRPAGTPRRRFRRRQGRRQAGQAPRSFLTWAESPSALARMARQMKTGMARQMKLDLEHTPGSTVSPWPANSLSHRGRRSRSPRSSSAPDSRTTRCGTTRRPA